MKKIAICIAIALVLGTGVVDAKSQNNEKAGDITRVVIGLSSLSGAKETVIYAVKNNGGTFVREMLDGALIFNIPTSTLDKLKSNPDILENAVYIKEDIQIKLPTPEVKEVSSGEENIHLIPNDPLYSKQWGIPMIGANKAWDILRGDGVLVAVIDTGVDYTHEDLAVNINESLGWDFANNDNDAMDDNGHGTHVAGIIAATMNNNKGVVGVAPNTTIMPVKVCNKFGSCWLTDVADGIRYAVDNGASIISISLGSPLPDTWTYDATRYAVQKGALIIAAAGNRGIEAPEYPAAYPWVLAIGALDHDGNKAYYSQYGDFLDLTAPGGSSDGIPEHDIISTYLNNSYAYMAGTSMATPYASGVAALYWSHNLSYTNKQVGIWLLRFADDLGAPGWDKYYGYGRVDAYPPDG